MKAHLAISLTGTDKKRTGAAQAEPAEEKEGQMAARRAVRRGEPTPLLHTLDTSMAGGVMVRIAPKVEDTSENLRVELHPATLSERVLPAGLEVIKPGWIDLEESPRSGGYAIETQVPPLHYVKKMPPKREKGEECEGEDGDYEEGQEEVRDGGRVPDSHPGGLQR